MSTAASLLSASSSASYPRVDSLTLRQTVITFVVTVVLAGLVYYAYTQRQVELAEQRQQQLASLGSYFNSTNRLTPEQIAALQATGIPGVDAMLSNLSRGAQEWDSMQQQFATMRKQSSERESLAAVARSNAVQLRSQIQLARERLDELVTYMTKWTTQYLPLLTNDAGRCLAASPTHLQLALVALRRARPSDSQVETWSWQIDELRAPLEAAWLSKDAAAVVTDEHVRVIDEVGKAVWRELDLLQRDQRILDALLSETKTVVPHKTTLQEIVHAQELAEAKQQLQRHEETRQAALAPRTTVREPGEFAQVADATRVKRPQISLQPTNRGAQTAGIQQWASDAERRRAQTRTSSSRVISMPYSPTSAASCSCPRVVSVCQPIPVRGSCR